MTTMKVFKWIWAWEDEKEEAWLREMSQKGWHFQSCSLPGIYLFEQGQAKDYVYRLDYFTNNKDKGNYLQLFLDAGWKYMGEMGGWQYFRIETVNGQAPEIFSDNESKAKKYQRLLLILVAISPIYIVNVSNFNHSSGTLEEVIRFVMFLFLMLFLYAITKLALRIRTLKKKI
jgi:hypothetical protein